MAGCIKLALVEDSNIPSTNSVSLAFPVQLTNDWDYDKKQGETMQVGTKSPSGLTFSKHLDDLILDFTRPHCVQLLTNALPVSKEDAEAWVFKNARDPIYLWDLLQLVLMI